MKTRLVFTEQGQMICGKFPLSVGYNEVPHGYIGTVYSRLCSDGTNSAQIIRWEGTIAIFRRGSEQWTEDSIWWTIQI